MSGEVVDSNPYSRLMALQRMGIVKDYERIRDKTVGGWGGGWGWVGQGHRACAWRGRPPAALAGASHALRCEPPAVS